jgi:hypothetical protein
VIEKEKIEARKALRQEYTLFLKQLEQQRRAAAKTLTVDIEGSEARIEQKHHKENTHAK